MRTMISTICEGGSLHCLDLFQEVTTWIRAFIRFGGGGLFEGRWS